MLTRRPVLIGLGIGAAVLAMRSFAQQTSEPVSGTWTGILNAGVVQLRLKFEIAPDGTATLSSLDQGNQPVPAQATSRTAEHVEIEVPLVRGTFSGRAVSADRIEGTWKQLANETPLVLLKGEAGLKPLAVEPLTPASLEALRARAKAPALAAAAVVKGKPAQKWAAGERASGSGVAVTANDVWHFGSITKSMTATLVARLVEQGAIKWDDTIGEVLKDVAPQMQDAYKPVTFVHLLSHRAGLQPNVGMADLMKFTRELQDAREERRTCVRLALEMSPVGPMTTTFTYANNGYIVAGAMLEARLGKPWEVLIREQLFQPLKLASAGFGAPGEKGKLTQPVGHSMRPDGAYHRHLPEDALNDNPAMLGPAGRVHMSFDDMLTYLAAHRDRISLLKPESWQRLHTPPFGGEYAMGWMVRPDGALTHNGSNTLWMAQVLFNSSTGAAGVAAANYAGPASGPAVSDALMRALRAVEG